MTLYKNNSPSLCYVLIHISEQVVGPYVTFSVFPCLSRPLLWNWAKQPCVCVVFVMSWCVSEMEDSRTVIIQEQWGLPWWSLLQCSLKLDFYIIQTKLWVLFAHHHSPWLWMVFNMLRCGCKFFDWLRFYILMKVTKLAKMFWIIDSKGTLIVIKRAGSSWSLWNQSCSFCWRSSFSSCQLIQMY